MEEIFGFHAVTPESAERHRRLKRQFINFSKLLDEDLDGGRAKSLVMTKLQEASMWAHYSIAQNDPVVNE